MVKASASYIIGIDLGTTNCTMSYVPISEEKEVLQIEQFSIDQIVPSPAIGSSFSLPSCIYYPLAEETQKQELSLPWDKQKK